MKEMKTAFVPNAGDALQLIKLIPTVIITDVHDCAGVTSKFELFGLKRIVKLPFVEEPLQFGSVSDANTRPNREVSLIRSIHVAHGFSTLTRHKISDREPGKACHAAKAWMANTQNVSRSLARGSLHRLVRPSRHFGGSGEGRVTDPSACSIPP